MPGSNQSSVNWQQRRAEALAAREKYLEKAIPLEFQTFSPELCPCIDSHNLVAKFLPPSRWDEACKEVPAYKGGVLLHGRTGTGKTRAAFAMLRGWVNEFSWEGCPYSFRYVSAPVLKRQLADAARAGKAHQVIEDMVSAEDEALFIDDLSQARFTAAFAENLFELVDRIYRERRALVVTCQSTGRQLIQKWCSDDRDLVDTAEAIARRLRDYCTPFHFKEEARVAPAKPPAQSE